MSLVTTCPACGTAFRVTPAQLSAHRGDVRCGQCRHVFNALPLLTEIPATAIAPDTEPAAPVEESSTGFQETVILPPPAEKTAAEPPIDAPVEAEAEETDEIPAPLPETMEIDTAHLDMVLEPPPDQEETPTASGIPTDPEPPPAKETPLPPLAQPAPAIAPQPPKQAAGLLADKPRRRWPSWLLALCTLLLLLGLLGQAAYFLRTEIAAHFPPAKPWLVQGCQWLGCTVELPRQAELLTIEDSDLKDDPDHEGVLVLTYVLYNRAPYAQAYPLLELTLTDTFDKPVLRHTFTPREYLPGDTDIAAGLAPGREESGNLHLMVSGEKPAGYRLWVRH